MKVFTDINDPQIVSMLQAGAIGVIRTDTLYGIVCVATNKASVERIYALKGRDNYKSPIVLVANNEQLFDSPSPFVGTVLIKYWPGPVSVIIPSIRAPKWIRRENNSVAYRLPDSSYLQTLLEQTGPLIAPSANPQGKPPAVTVAQAVKYFGSDVDFYVDGGEVLNVAPSRILRVTDHTTIEQLR